MEHPVIGAWTAMLDAGRGFGSDYATTSFHPDGTMTLTISGYTAHGVWQVVDAGNVRFRAVAPLGPAEVQTGWHTLAFDVKVTPDSNALSLDCTYTRPTPSGAPAVTTITGSAERLAIDPK